MNHANGPNMQPTKPNEYITDHGLQAAIDSLSEESDAALPDARAHFPVSGCAPIPATPLERVRQWSAQRAEMLDVLRKERVVLTTRLAEVDALVAELDGGGQAVAPEVRRAKAPAKRPVGRPRKVAAAGKPSGGETVPAMVLRFLRDNPNSGSPAIKREVKRFGRNLAGVDVVLTRLRARGSIKRFGARRSYRYSVAK